MSYLTLVHPPTTPDSSSATPSVRCGDVLRHELAVAAALSFEDLVASIIGPSMPQVARVQVSMG